MLLVVLNRILRTSRLKAFRAGCVCVCVCVCVCSRSPGRDAGARSVEKTTLDVEAA